MNTKNTEKLYEVALPVITSARELAIAASYTFNAAGDDYARKAITQLAEAFHVLKGRPGVRPWDERELHAWYKRGRASTHELSAAVFVLSVWNPTGPWPKFKFQPAFQGWDRSNRDAFAGWAMDPWWP